MELLSLVRNLAEKAGGRTNYSDLWMEQDVFPYEKVENLSPEDRPRENVGGRAPQRNYLI